MSSAKEAIMDLTGSRRRGSAPKAGSVWESRMKSDQVKGGIKVYEATNDDSEQNVCTSTTATTTTLTNNDDPEMDKKLKPKQSPVGGLSTKRKTWKSEGSPVQIAKQRSELSKNMDERSVSADGIKKSPNPIKKTRSVASSQKGIDGDEKSEIQLRKVKSDSNEVINENSKNLTSIQSVKSKTEPENKEVLDENSKSKNAVDEQDKDLEGRVERIQKSPDGRIKKSRSDEDCKEFGVCEEKAMNVGRIRIGSPSDDDDSVEGGEEDFGGDEEEEDDKEEIEVEKRRGFDVKEITMQEQKPKKIVVEDKKLLHSNERPVPASTPIFSKKALLPPVNHAKIHPGTAETKPNQSEGIPRSNSKIQSFVDLIMWRDVSKSAFVFGVGTFAIISSSYKKDLNISFISVASYVGLVYLAAIFLFRSLTTRASVDMYYRDQDYVVGEEEAMWIVKLILPYVNEFLLKLRALFSGDPATTMKLAVLLFILSRCGSSITIWKMAKLGFIGVFTVPKICSSYSIQLTAYGTFWIRRFQDAWESCSHKKAVGFAIFTLVWNLSSVAARIWAVFMLFVGFKYYQQTLMREGWAQQQEEEDRTEHYFREAGPPKKNIGGGRRSTPTATLTELGKQKKVG